MQADWIIWQGDTAPLFPDTLTYGDGNPVDLRGATVQFVMRDPTTAAPLALTGTTTITGPATGDVQFAPSPQDTSAPGTYLACWIVNFAGSTMTFPTDGFLSVDVRESLTTAAGMLIGLPVAKDYLNITATDRGRDGKLIAAIRSLRPIVENITGPIVPTVYDELHDGGSPMIQIRRRPSSSYDTAPILDQVAVEEVVGSTTRTLAVVTSAALGTSYSCMIDTLGTITRRTSGGGSIAFAPGSQNIHVQYRAGQSSVPPNVTQGTLELLRMNYSTTLGVGRGRLTVADDEDTGAPLGFFVPRRVRELLAPNRRAPSIA